MIEAKVVADSVYVDQYGNQGPRLTSVQATGNRFILAELNTHRAFSRNSASSRAIPFSKQVKRIEEDLAYPAVFPAEQKGMQGGEEVEHVEDWVDDEGQDREGAKTMWSNASEYAVETAQQLAALGVHKSVVNRLLEPFMWHTVLITSTAWENFFVQRCSPLAQPEIRVMAEAIRDAMADSEPQVLRERAVGVLGQWHLPYIEFGKDDYAAATYLLDSGQNAGPDDVKRVLVRVSAARCARLSYLTQEGTRDIAEDLRLYQRLTEAQPPHWSPLEHVATPWTDNRQVDYLAFRSDLTGQPTTIRLDHLPAVGNLLGWRSLRTEVEAERDAVTYR